MLALLSKIWRRNVVVTAAPLAVILSLVSSGVVLPSPREKARVEGRTVVLTSTSSSSGAIARPGWKRVMESPIPVNMVGFEWKGKEHGAVELSTKTENGWSEWIEFEGNPDEGPDPGSSEYRHRTSTVPQWVGSGIRDLQVRVTEGSLSNLKIHMIRSEPSTASWSARSASATTEQPGIISRAQWGADESWRSYASECNGNPSYASGVRNTIVHHTATSNNYSWEEAAAVIRGIYHYHTHANGWCDIGYNFLVDKYGRVFEGRYGGTDKAVIGAHAGGFNTGSTGVAVLGDLQVASVSGATFESLRSLLAWKLTYHGVDAQGLVNVVSSGSSRYAAGTAVTLWTISGHQDVSATACPGNLYSLLPRLRTETQRMAMSTPPHPLPGWQPQPGYPAMLTLDAYGGLHPAGGHTSVEHHGFWPEWSIARGGIHEGDGGYLVDGWGGIHTFGDVPDRIGSGYWGGWDIVRGMARGPLKHSGYVLDGFGGIHPFGGIPSLPISAYWSGWDIAKAIATNASGLGGYVLDGFGGIHQLGNAPAVVASAYWGGWDIARSIALRPDGVSGYVLDGWGGLHPFGGAPPMDPPHYSPGQDIARSLALTPDGGGGWILDQDGEVWGFGNATSVKLSITWTKLGVGRAILVAPPGSSGP